MHTWKAHSLPTTKKYLSQLLHKKKQKEPISGSTTGVGLKCQSGEQSGSSSLKPAISESPCTGTRCQPPPDKGGLYASKTPDAATTTLTALLQEEQQSNREAILQSRAAVDDLLLRANPGCERREGSGWHPRARTGPCWVPKGRQRARAGHRKAYGGLRAAPKGKRRALGSPKREMEGLGRHRKAVWQPLACPERPTPVPRGHGKAEVP